MSTQANQDGEPKEVNIKIDGTAYRVPEGISLIKCADSLGHTIPTLCDFKDLMPSGTCRVCNVLVDGRFQSACMLKTYDGLEIDNSSEKVVELRKAVIEMMFLEGNHICPVCEKSGNCELQSLAYHYQMTAQRFPQMYPKRKLDASAPNLMVEYNRCIQCRRCIRGIRTPDDERIFFFENRGENVKLVVDPSRYEDITPQVAHAASNICPVGALMKKEPGYQVPIGKRHNDKMPKEEIRHRELEAQKEANHE